MLSNRELSEIALSGRWLYAANVWLDQNTPCSRQDAIEGIIKIMPTTVRIGNGKLGSRSLLAFQAVKRYCMLAAGQEIPDVIGKRVKKSSTRIEPLMVSEIRRGGPAMGRDFKSVNHAVTRLRNQFLRGQLLRAGGIYYVEGQDPAAYVQRDRFIDVEAK